MHNATKMPRIAPVVEIEYVAGSEQKRFLRGWKLIQQSVIVVNETLDLTVLHMAITQLVEQQEGLRSFYNQKTLKVLIKDTVDIPFFMERVTSEALDQKLEMTMADDRKSSYRRDGLQPHFRFYVFTVDVDQTQILFSYDHVLLDGWSRRVFLSQLFKIYRALIAGNEAPKLPLSSSYPSYLEYLDRLQVEDQCGDGFGKENATRRLWPRPIPAIGRPRREHSVGEQGEKTLKHWAFGNKLEKRIAPLAAWAVTVAGCDGQAIFSYHHPNRFLPIHGLKNGLGSYYIRSYVSCQVPDQMNGEWLQLFSQDQQRIEKWAGLRDGKLIRKKLGISTIVDLLGSRVHVADYSCPAFNVDLPGCDINTYVIGELNDDEKRVRRGDISDLTEVSVLLAGAMPVSVVALVKTIGNWLWRRPLGKTASARAMKRYKFGSVVLFFSYNRYQFNDKDLDYLQLEFFNNLQKIINLHNPQETE